MKKHLLPIVLAIAAVGCVETLSAQRGGGGRRGPPESIRSRLGSWFVTATLPAGSAKVDLAETAHVKGAAKNGELSLLYLFDPRANPDKHKRFEQALFGHQTVSVALKYFHCGRADVSGSSAYGALAKKAPLFVAFDKAGKRVGAVSMRGYKATTKGLVALLNNASKGYSKVPVNTFVKKYRTFLSDLQRIENDKSNINSKRQRLIKKGTPAGAKDKALAKEEAKIAEREVKLFKGEEKLLKDAKIPQRAAGAQRVGERERRGR